MQRLPGLAKENATLQLKVEKMRSTTTQLQSENEAIFVVTEERKMLRNQTRMVVINVTALKKHNLELETELSSKCEHAAAANMREDAVKSELASIREELVASHEEWSKLWWICLETVSQTQQREIDVNETLKVFSHNAAAVCAQNVLNCSRRIDEHVSKNYDRTKVECKSCDGQNACRFEAFKYRRGSR